MAFNRDTKSIFDKYVNSILEAVKPTEEGGPFDPAAAAAKRQELLNQRGQEVVNQANTRRIDPSTQQGQAALANQQTQQQQAQQTQQQQRQQQQAQSAASLSRLQTPGSKTFGSTTSNTTTAPATQSSSSMSSADAAKYFDQMAANAGLGNSASKPTQQELNNIPLAGGAKPNTQTTATTDQGQTYTEDQIMDMINNLNMQALPASDEEFK